METLRLYTPLKAFFNDLAEVVRVFFPDVQVMEGEKQNCDLLHEHEEENGWGKDTLTANQTRRSFSWTAPLEGDEWEIKRRRKRGMKTACYQLLRRETGMRPPWGSLTGIRPTRLYDQRLSQGDSWEEAERTLMGLYDLGERRARLLRRTVETQKTLPPVQESHVDVYVGIPFCTTRCAYCSFFAEAIGKGKKVPAYMEALLKEIEAAREIVRDHGLSVRALYVGGGTPTSLNPAALDTLMNALQQAFPENGEWTVEAGRPDTIDPDRLKVLKSYPVNRISVNPQTMNDETLRRIGRAHTARDVEEAFERARNMGFENINMDLIAALPGESLADFLHTLECVRRMNPENLTVHTLARKHGSRLNEFGFEATDGETARAMVEAGDDLAVELGMSPYYLYRQKYVAGNLENVGYARKGTECLYNVDIMEETTSILALGAGGISKRIFSAEARIERAPNVGDIGHYIQRVDEMIQRKRELFSAPGRVS